MRYELSVDVDHQTGSVHQVGWKVTDDEGELVALGVQLGLPSTENGLAAALLLALDLAQENALRNGMAQEVIPF